LPGTNKIRQVIHVTKSIHTNTIPKVIPAHY
jgi:hypothetical protein